MSDSGIDCVEGERVHLGNFSSPKVLCDELRSIATDGQLPDRFQSLKPESSGRQRHNSLCSPSRKRPDQRRRSRSVQLDKSNDLHFEKKSLQKKFVSTAEAMYKFQRSTPERFHTKPVIDGSQRWQASQVNPSYKKLRCTVPQSPNFTSHLRVRPVTYPSKEEREEAELQQMQKYIFKAAPLKADILKEPQLPKKVDPKPVTKPSPFQLTEVKKFTGAAKPINESQTVRTNRNIFPDEKRAARSEHNTDHPVWEKKVAEAVANKDMEQKGVKKATPIKRVTVPAPFTFEERDRIRQQQKEEKIRQVLEEEKRAREFRANPIPKSVKCSVSQSELKSHPPTQPEPFHLYTEERRVQHEEALKAKLEEDRRAAEVTRFKARPPVVLMKKPFEPVKPQRVFKEITAICLNTDIRSKERERFEMKIKEKEMLMEEYRRQLKEEQEREEEEEKARLRREAIHKAQPISKYAPVVVAKSTKELTVPESPFSRTKTYKH
ncbi:targeting protein for Xklp2 homolog isoform X2 [Schistocerca cancellata]|uniref:targeting protein for Xklp2 homolog isoform X2 n=1 Tax=Schistocerca cancellata TaxID=274614 RepID=UPI0021195ABF|nr:targeting protein for Xklp2 homolog isoform X2 [Schistocerca cancellata]